MMTEAFVHRFNSCVSPKQVLELAEEMGLTVEKVCAQLASDSRVGVTMLGECLGHHHPFWQVVCSQFACHFDFGGLDLTTALRRYLWRFRLPGEAAPIGRILEGFALGYHTANPPPVACPSTMHSIAPGVSGGTDPASRGWYIHQPMVKRGQPCCIACGALERPDSALWTCTGCRVIVFCAKCKRSGSRYGHAIGGCIGFGRACESAARANGLLHNGDLLYASPVVRGGYEKTHVGMEDRGHWIRAPSPIKTRDSVFVLAYAIVMLSTNLHNPSVKPADKMALHQFLADRKSVV